MTLDELDTLLGKWQRDIAATSQNLIAFEESPSYKTLKTAFIHLEGETRKLVEPAMTAIDQIWEHYGKLSEIIKEAVTLRQKMPFAFGRSDHIKRIEQLIVGPSISFQVKEIPLAERGLLGNSHVTKVTTPQDVFTMMQAKFSEVGTAISKYEKLGDELTQRIKEVSSDLSFRFQSSESDVRLAEIELLAHTDPVAGLELIKKLKKTAKSSGQQTVNQDLPSAGGSLHTFFQPAKTIGKQPDVIDKLQELAVNEGPAPVTNWNSPLENLLSKAKINAPASEIPTPTSLENLFGASNSEPANSTPELPATKPETTLEDLFNR